MENFLKPTGILNEFTLIPYNVYAEKRYLIALCDGHGMKTSGKRTPYIGELGRIVHENEFNRAVVKYLEAELKRCNFDVLLVAPTDADTSLTYRTNLANQKGADAYISIHYNAFDGKFNGNDPEGFSIHVYPGHAPSHKLANCIHKYLKQGTPQQDRGVKEDNFHVLRETKMVAILSENGFMDNKREALLMLKPEFQKEVAIEHAKGICDYFGKNYVSEKVHAPSNPSSNHIGVIEVLVSNLNVRSSASFSSSIVKVIEKGDKYRVYAEKNGLYNLGGDQWTSAGKEYVKFTPAKTTLYKVQVGAFSNKSNADNLDKELEKKGFSAFVIKEGNLYKVQCGAFSNKSNADSLAKKLNAKGYKTFIDVE
jgi:N-acetylmuramoyl-L-alanine amidase